jgi:hypothetical protein
MIPTTTPLGAIMGGINPNVGWAKQLHLSSDAGAIYNSHRQRDGRPHV